MNNSENQLSEWIKSRLDAQSKDLNSIFYDIRPRSIDFEHYLKEVLEPLGLPYTIYSEDWSSIVYISEEITIRGSYCPEDVSTDFTAIFECLGKKFTLNVFPTSVPLPYLKDYLQVLRMAIDLLKQMSSEITLRFKEHRKSELLAALIQARLDELGTDNISKEIKVIPEESDYYDISYPINSTLSLLVNVSIKNYTDQIDRLIEIICSERVPDCIKGLTFINVVNDDTKLYRCGKSMGPIWAGESRQIPYASSAISSAEYIVENDYIFPNNLRQALDECGYKYYIDNDLYILLNDDSKIVRTDKSYFLRRDDKVVGDGFEMEDCDFIILLRIIAALPVESITRLSSSLSFEQMIDSLFSYEICKYLLPDYCLFRQQPASGDIIVFPVTNFQQSVAVIISNKKRNYRDYLTVLTNLEDLHKLLTDPQVMAIASKDEDIIPSGDKYAAEILIKLNGARDLCRAFMHTNASSIDLTDFNTQNATTMRAMFKNCRKVTKLNTYALCTSNVTDMSEMFKNCGRLTNLDLSLFDTSNVTDMSGMFYSCSPGLKNLNITNFNTSKVSNMSGMFYRCSELRELDISNFDTSMVADMSEMFYNCKEVRRLDVSGFDTKKVTSMREMFKYCINLSPLNVSNFTTSNVMDMEGMFMCCRSVEELDVRGFDTTRVTSTRSMFRHCWNLLTLDLSSFNTLYILDLSYMFAGCNKLAVINLSNWEINDQQKIEGMFECCNGLKTIIMRGCSAETVILIKAQVAADGLTGVTFITD